MNNETPILRNFEGEVLWEPDAEPQEAAESESIVTPTAEDLAWARELLHKQPI